MTTSLSFSRKVAFRYLWSRRSEAAITIITVISVLGVAIGVIVLNMVMAVMTGFQQEWRKRLIGTEAHVIVRTIGGKISNPGDITVKLAALPGVRSISPFTSHQALLRTTNQASGIIIRGVKEGTAGADLLSGIVTPKTALATLFSPPPVPSESSDEEVNLPGILVGREIAKNLSLFPGSIVSLLSPQVSSTPFGLVPKFKRFVVVGYFEGGLYDGALGYVSLPEAQQFFKMGESVSGLELRVDDLDKTGELSKKISDLLGGEGGGFFVQDWAELNKAFFEAMKLETRAYFVVLLLIIVMASFSIISSLIMVVLEKRKDIAVMKTIGATSSSIGSIFKIQGAAIGGMGVVLGLIGAYIGCIALREYGFPIDERIFQMSTLPINIDPVNFLVVGISAFAICCIATIYPAKRASRLEPVEILRSE